MRVKRCIWNHGKYNYNIEEDIIGEKCGLEYRLEKTGRFMFTFVAEDDCDFSKNYEYVVVPAKKKTQNEIINRLEENNWKVLGKRTGGKLYFRREAEWKDELEAGEFEDKHKIIREEKKYINNLKLESMIKQYSVNKIKLVCLLLLLIMAIAFGRITSVLGSGLLNSCFIFNSIINLEDIFDGVVIQNFEAIWMYIYYLVLFTVNILIITDSIQLIQLSIKLEKQEIYCKVINAEIVEKIVLLVLAFMTIFRVADIMRYEVIYIGKLDLNIAGKYHEITIDRDNDDEYEIYLDVNEPDIVAEVIDKDYKVVNEQMWTFKMEELEVLDRKIEVLALDEYIGEDNTTQLRGNSKIRFSYSKISNKQRKDVDIILKIEK